ncbi:MAG TPA: addiction module antidote protein, HigA family [Lentisphaeria bacterium]|nr:MAG: addiction module antidote protein, HigA family [Lentisphaerae bacterium GWF2_50_93]HCE42691.1 addiction module antidote protein, HigA family [Lentisphaeria bacterium]
MSTKKMKPIHPGEILVEEFMKPMGISQNRLARDIGVPPRRINEICLEKRGVTADTSLRLGIYFKMGPEFWINLQKNYEMDCVRQKEEKELKHLIKPCPNLNPTPVFA